MRVTAGLYKFKKINSINNKIVRPTSSKVRQALFNMLLNRYRWEDWSKNAHLLDAFSGSGIISIEAFSRNLSQATIIEKDEKVFKLLENNFSKLKLIKKVKLIKDSFFNVNLKRNHYDIVYLDPPYDKDFVNTAIEKILEEKALKINSIIACETEKNYKFNDSFIKYINISKNYGNTSITIFKFN